MMLRLTTLGRLSIDGRTAPGAGDVRPQRLAFLAVLAAAGPNGVSRDRVVDLLWTDSEPERARHSLAQMLYRLRRELDANAVLATPTLLSLDASVISSDVADFRAAVAEQRWDTAAHVFAGPFLDGFYLADVPEFERWVESTRSELQHDAARAIEAAARRAVAASRPQDAEILWRRLTQLDPTSSRFATSYIEVLLAGGDRAGALLHAQAHADRVRRELEMEPEPGIVAIIDGLRDARGTATVAQTSRIATEYSRPAASDAQASDASPPVSRDLPPRRRSRTIGFVVLFAVLAVVGPTVAMNVSALKSAFGNRFPGASRVSAVRSPVAVRLYEDGLRAFYQFDPTEASRLFDAAIKEDPGFALATYYRWRAELLANGPRQDSLAARVRSAAERASERDRALMLTHLAVADWDPRALATMDSLVARFPTDVDLLIRDGDIAVELPRAVALLDSAISRDSASASPNSPCARCEALDALVKRYVGSDSLRRAEQTLDRWSAMRPADYQPSVVRAELALGEGRRHETETLLRRADSLGAPKDRTGVAALVRHLRLNDVDSANTTCAESLRRASAALLERYQRLCTINLRMQGRFRDALGLVRGGLVPGSNVVRHELRLDAMQAATLDMEMNRPSAAAVMFASLAAVPVRVAGGDSVRLTGAVAHSIVGALTLSAMASSMFADTLRVRALVDSVELIGHRSLDPRDPLLHHALRGLVSAAAGEHERAVVEFRAALASPSPTFTRIHYELGKSLLALNRPREVIPVMRTALMNGADGPALFLTTTEAHELLARAFVAANEADSAAAHYAIVERSWRLGDSLVMPRYVVARQWLLRTGRISR